MIQTVCSSLRRLTRLSAVVPLAAIVLNASAASAQSLGSAETFAVLGGPAVSCTTSPITGDVGVVLATGFANIGCTIAGTVHLGDTAANAAYASFLSAYNAFAVSAPCTTLTGTLAGMTLPPGVYCFPAAAALTGTLFLDAGFNANAAWVFKIGTLGTGALTATDFSVQIINPAAAGGQSCNVTWWVRDATTLTRSTLLGTILAGADITMTGGTLVGHALAKGAVTLTDTRITVCAPGPVVPPVVDKCDEHHGDDGDDNDHDRDHHGKDGDHHDKDGDHHDKDGDHHAKGHADKDGDHHDNDKCKDQDHDRDKDHKDGDHKDKDSDAKKKRG